MKFCISPVKISVLINEGLEGVFNAHRGIRQGDPLSLFLFLLAIEGLNNMFKIAQVSGWIQGFEVARNSDSSLEITYLQYVDDTLIFFMQRKSI